MLDILTNPTDNKESQENQTRTQEYENQRKHNEQTQIRNCIVQPHATKATKAAKQILLGIKSEISYTPEDGHVGRNM
jgi:hypothetical protein